MYLLQCVCVCVQRYYLFYCFSNERIDFYSYVVFSSYGNNLIMSTVIKVPIPYEELLNGNGAITDMGGNND